MRTEGKGRKVKKKPVVDLNSDASALRGTLRGGERKKKGRRMPSYFIPIAEEEEKEGRERDVKSPNVTNSSLRRETLAAKGKGRREGKPKRPSFLYIVAGLT